MARFNDIQTVSIPSIGRLPLAEDPGELDLGGYKREAKHGVIPGDGGYTESFTASQLDLNLNPQAQVDLAALANVAGEDVTVRLKNGAVYMLPQAWVAEPPKLSQGSLKLMINCDYPAERIT